MVRKFRKNEIGSDYISFLYLAKMHFITNILNYKLLS